MTQGAFGGILIFWDSRSMQLLDKEEGLFSLSCKFKLVEEDLIWIFFWGLWTL